MAQPPLQLIIGNYNTSSWSLRAWLVLRLARLAFVELRVPLRRADTAERVRRYSPSGKLPVLLVDGAPVWESLAIAELVAELEPTIWPIDAARRAEARAISAEVHAGFADLRRLMPMDLVSRFTAPGRLPRGLAGDIARVTGIWRHCRDRHASDGPFLFGAFSVADAMLAPIAARFVTYAVPLDPALEDYVDSVMSWPDMVVWREAAAAEQQEALGQGSLGLRPTARAGRELGGEVATARPVGGSLAAATVAAASPATGGGGNDRAPLSPEAEVPLAVAMVADTVAPFGAVAEQDSPPAAAGDGAAAAAPRAEAAPPSEPEPEPEPEPRAAPQPPGPAPAQAVEPRAVPPGDAADRASSPPVPGPPPPEPSTIKPIGSGILRRR